MNNRLLISYYGDDFTGSADTMEAMTRCGIRAALFLDPPSPEQLARFGDLEAVGVAGVSRTMSPQEMDAQLPGVFRRLRALGAPVVHYKICSTFDSSPQIGSIGRALDIGQRVFETPFVPMLVGAPRLWRHCVFGNLFARSGAESEVFRLDRHPTMAQHPITPMHESDIRLHLAQQTQKQIGLFDILQLDAPDWDEVARRFDALLQSRPEAVLLDILYDHQSAAIGHLLWRYASPEKPLFVVGSSGVEHALTDYWRAAARLPERELPPAAGQVKQLLVISGSCSPVTERQIERALEYGFAEVPVKPEQLVNPDTADSCIEEAANRVVRLLDKGCSVIVHTARGPQDPRIETLTQYFYRLGYDDLKTKLSSGKALGEPLGVLARKVLARYPLARVALSGGDTSSYMARQMGIEALEVKAPFAPAMPLCRVHAAHPGVDGLEMIFKGGQTGTVNFFLDVQRGQMG
jgi:uncharacterized protein YgbK (DUF1537 family)